MGNSKFHKILFRHIHISRDSLKYFELKNEYEEIRIQNYFITLEIKITCILIQQKFFIEFFLTDKPSLTIQTFKRKKTVILKNNFLISL